MPSKPIASSAPATPPNYAKVVAEDGSGSRNIKSKRKEDVVPDQPVKTAAAVVATSAASSPVVEKKEVPVKETNSPTTSPADKKEDMTPKATPESDSAESIAKNSKLNPNAKEFTLNPAAKPFTPRSQQPQQPVVQPHHNAPPVQYSNQGPNVVASVHHIPNQHFQQQNQPQMIPIQTQGMPRMQNQQVHLLHPQMVVPGASMFPYPVMPQYAQPIQMNQTRPGKQSSKYQNPGNRNDQYNQNSLHNVAAATGHPVLATAPMPYQQQPGLAQLFQPMYQMQGFNPRMPVGMMGPQVSYDPSHMYRKLSPATPCPCADDCISPSVGALPVSMVAQSMSQQQNNGHHSNPSTPQQSQTPTTPGMHAAGPPTPGPHQGQTPTPQQTVMYTGQNLPPHSIAGGFNNQNMVLMGPPPPAAGPHPHPQPMAHQPAGGQQGHAVPLSVLQSSATPIVMQQQQHYQQNQPPPGR